MPSYFTGLILLPLIWLAVRSRKRTGRRLPPGPSPRVLFGNLFDWPFQSGWLTFTEWKRLYGDVVHLEIFGLHIIILNTFEAALSLMGQVTCSDRPHLAMAGDLMGFGQSLVLSPYGDHWKAMRRFTQQHFNKLSSAKFFDSQVSDARLLLQLLLKNPQNHIPALRFSLGKNLIENTYGIPCDSPDAEFVKISREMHEVIQNAVIPGSFLVDIFPSMKFIPSWLPGANFRRLAKVARARGRRVLDGAFDAAKTQATSTETTQSVIVTLLRDDSHGMPQEAYENVLKWAAGSLYGAGTESSVSGISTLLLMMVMYPDIQEKAQIELDNVLGGKRLPTFKDREQLPYLGAIIKESLRFQPPTPLGIAHSLSADETYKGYDLPKGSIVLSNIWGMSKDPQYYNSPMRFDPERHLKLDPELDPSAIVFGFGRRACLGTHYSQAAMFITAASVLSVFNIRAQDEYGAPVEVKAEFTGGFVSHPRPFPCVFIPRSDGAIQLIQSVGSDC